MFSLKILPRLSYSFATWYKNDVRLFPLEKQNRIALIPSSGGSSEFKCQIFSVVPIDLGKLHSYCQSWFLPL